MSLLGATSVENKMPSSFALKIPDGARILIVCDDESDTERLNIALRKAGLASECAKSIAAGCEAAKSGRFQVVVSKPLLSDVGFLKDGTPAFQNLSPRSSSLT